MLFRISEYSALLLRHGSNKPASKKNKENNSLQVSCVADIILNSLEFANSLAEPR